MFSTVKQWLFGVKDVIAGTRKIAFIDGDQFTNKNMSIYRTHILKKGYECQFITASNIPKKVTKEKRINITRLHGFRAGKEATDKYISAYMQKSIGEGYNDILIVSSDYDFVDIFKMTAMLNTDAKTLKFTLVVPDSGRWTPKQTEHAKHVDIVRV